MPTVVADMSVSLVGYVADPAGGVDRVFAWYGKPQPAAQPTEPPDEAAAFGLGVIVYGRRTFDQAKVGWSASDRGAGDRPHPRDPRSAGRGRIRPCRLSPTGSRGR